jgi:hypothetical protein
MDLAAERRWERWGAVALALLLAGWSVDRLDRQHADRSPGAEDAIRTCREAVIERWHSREALDFETDFTMRPLGRDRYRVTSHVRDPHTAFVSFACEITSGDGRWQVNDLILLRW